MDSYTDNQIKQIETKCITEHHLGENEKLVNVMNQDILALDSKEITFKQIKNLFEKIKYHMDYDISIFCDDIDNHKNSNSLLNKFINKIWNIIDTLFFNGVFQEIENNRGEDEDDYNIIYSNNWFWGVIDTWLFDGKFNDYHLLLSQKKKYIETYNNKIKDYEKYNNIIREHAKKFNWKYWSLGPVKDRLIFNNKIFVKEISWYGLAMCPFIGCNYSSCSDYIIINTDTYESIHMSGLTMHEITEHKFFQGLESKYRVDPLQLIKVFNMKPNIDYTTKLENKMSWDYKMDHITDSDINMKYKYLNIENLDENKYYYENSSDDNDNDNDNDSYELNMKYISTGDNEYFYNNHKVIILWKTYNEPFHKIFMHSDYLDMKEIIYNYEQLSHIFGQTKYIFTSKYKQIITLSEVLINWIQNE